MTPLERVARVLCEIDNGDPDEVRHGAGHAAGQTWLGWEAHASNARKVIEAIREPSDQMAAVGAFGGDVPLSAEVWRAMVDTLLEEEDAGR